MAIDDARFRTDDTALFALFDYLHILPVRQRTLLGRWAAASLVGWDLAIHIQQRFPMPAPAIRDQSRGMLGLAALPIHRQGVH